MKSFTIFGDSLMKGVVLDSVKNKYTQLRDCFVNLFSRDQYEVHNYARFGCTITKGRTIVDRHLGQIPESDYVVIEFGGNDCNFDWAKIAAAPDEEHLPVTPIDQFQEEYAQLIKRIQEKGKTPFLLNLPPLEYHSFFNWISKGLNAGNILKWLGDEARTYRWHEAYSKAVEVIATILNVPLVDIRTPFLEMGDYSAYVCPDGMHPNERGHAVINETVSRFRQAYLS